jgi:hypothetical protein
MRVSTKLPIVGKDQGSGYEWRRKRGWLNRTLEKIEGAPLNLLSRDRPLALRFMPIVLRGEARTRSQDPRTRQAPRHLPLRKRR